MKGFEPVFRSVLAALLFYTTLPLPASIPLDFRRIGRWLPLVGLVLGSCLVVLDWGLRVLFPPALAGGLLVAAYVLLTGGLHMDGAIDAADGDAAPAAKRLEVMQDSRTGAYGVMAAVLLLGLKATAVTLLPEPRWVYLLLTPMWARLGQLWAVWHYPYAKTEGKGRFLKEHTQASDLLLGVLTTVMPTLLLFWQYSRGLALWPLLTLLSMLAIGWRWRAGHTGDTYGAVVEWTEAIAWVWASYTRFS